MLTRRADITFVSQHPELFTSFRRSSAEKGKGMRVEVDLAKCTGHGICESIAEGVFEVQDDGTVTIHGPERPAAGCGRRSPSVPLPH